MTESQRRRSSFGRWAMWIILPAVLLLSIGALWTYFRRHVPKAIITVEAENPFALTLSPDGRVLAFGDGETIKLWNIERNELEMELSGHDEAVSSVTFRPDGKMLALVDRNGRVLLWNLEDSGCRRTTAADGNVPNLFVASVQKDDALHNVRSVAFAPDGKRLATGHFFSSAYGGAPGELRVWEIDTGSLITTINAHEEGIARIAYSPDGKLLASSCVNMEIKLWSTLNWHLEDSFKAHGGDYAVLAFSPDGKALANGGGWASGLRDVSFRDVAAKENFAPLQGESGKADIYGLDYSANGNLLAIQGRYPKLFGSRYTVELWEWPSGKPCGAVPCAAVNWGIAFSPDGKLLYVADAPRSVKVWDVSNCENLVH